MFVTQPPKNKTMAFNVIIWQICALNVSMINAIHLKLHNQKVISVCLPAAPLVSFLGLLASTKDP